MWELINQIFIILKDATLCIPPLFIFHVSGSKNHFISLECTENKILWIYWYTNAIQFKKVGDKLTTSFRSCLTPTFLDTIVCS